MISTCVSSDDESESLIVSKVRDGQKPVVPLRSQVSSNWQLRPSSWGKQDERKNPMTMESDDEVEEDGSYLVLMGVPSKSEQTSDSTTPSSLSDDFNDVFARHDSEAEFTAYHNDCCLVSCLTFAGFMGRQHIHPPTLH